MSLSAATRSEVTKQFSTSLWWILAIVLVVYVGSSSGGFAVLVGMQQSGALGDAEALPLGDGVTGLLYSFASSLGYVFALLVGALMTTGEFRHKTLTPTFLAVPKRGRVLLAKVIIGVLVGLLYGVIALLSAVGPAALILALYGEETALGDADTWAMFARILLALVLWTIIGIGVGALVRNQIAAVVGILVFTQFIEPLLRMGASFIETLGDVANYLPGAASDTLVGASFFELTAAPGATTPEWWVGGITLAVYAAVFLFLGWATSWRRDVA